MKTFVFQAAHKCGSIQEQFYQTLSLPKTTSYRKRPRKSPLEMTIEEEEEEKMRSEGRTDWRGGKGGEPNRLPVF